MTRRADPPTPSTRQMPEPEVRRTGAVRTAVIGIVLLAAVLRLWGLGSSPPGLNQDEAANAWNGWCILHTGHDQTGRAWPLLYMRAFGENRSTLYAYLQIPFLAVGGLHPTTARLPSALLGVVSVALAWYVGRKLFGTAAGLIAAGVLALNPWHLQLTRWGHEASLCPFLAVAGLAALVWMGLDFSGGRPRPRLLPAILAGILWGLSTWAYPAARIFMPVFFLGLLAASWRSWQEYFRAPRGRTALGALVACGAIFFLPMAYMHLAHPEILSVRLAWTAVYLPGDSLFTKFLKMAARYPGHFGLDYLFRSGDQYPLQTPPGMGMFHWYLLPAFCAGLGALAARRRTAGARILLAWLLLYPAGDLIGVHMTRDSMSMHALRSSSGIVAFALLAGLGVSWLGQLLWRRAWRVAVALASAMSLVVLWSGVTYLHRFYGPYNLRPEIYHGYQVDLLEACRFLRDRLPGADAVYCTAAGVNMPYVISLVGLQYDPKQWFQDERSMLNRGQWDVITGYGKMHFLYRQSDLKAMTEQLTSARPHRIYLILRPQEAQRLPLPPPIKVIRCGAEPVLSIYELNA